MAKIYYDKLVRGCVTGAYTFSMVPDRYKPEVKAMAKADLKAGILPQWQYDLMGIPEG
ncbi:MAG: hypothetical protein K6F53_10525 [Lachnospiraceae bacterium]|nr:hypothetical protein [Lachnospiraceae bacterium]